MKKYFLPVFLFMLIHALTNAQFAIENYPIDQFKLPDIDRQSLEFVGNLLGDINSQRNSSSDRHYTTSQFNPQFSLFYSRYINRADLQAFYTASTSPDLLMQSTSNEFEDQTDKYTSLNPDLNFSGQWLRYTGMKFTSLGVGSSLRYHQNYHTVEETGFSDQYRSHGLNANIEIPLGFGTGRLEPVSDMTMALFIIQDVILAGVDASYVSNEQINHFASRMVELRNERVFDTRIKRIHELRELYSLMKENQWTLPDDPGFFTVLTDNWLYNMNVFRLSGKRWTYSFVPSYDLASNKTKINSINDFSTSAQTIGGEFRVDFGKYRPVNIHHDVIRTHGLTAGVSRVINRANSNRSNDNYILAGISTTYGHQWIPNSRTLVSASVGLDYSYYYPFGGTSQGGDDDHRLDLSLRGRTNYFISYRTRLFADFSMDYTWHQEGNYILIDSNPIQIEEVNNGFHARLNGGITVSIF